MKTNTILVLFIFFSISLSAQKNMDKETISTSKGDLEIYFVGHGSLMFQFDGMVIHADASSREADYSQLPKADLILVTHHHGDHFDPSAIEKIKTEDTKVILNWKSAENAGDMSGTEI